MRMLSLALLCLAVTAIAANAEPPPQTPAPTVAAAIRMDAAIVTQVDSPAAVSASSTAAVVDSSPNIAKREGHGMGFWAVIAVVVLAALYGAYRWLARPRVSEDELPDRTQTPGSSGRSKNF